MKPIRVVVVNSKTRPGMLSIRAKEGDASGTAIYRALTESGAKVGDILEIRAVPMSKLPPSKVTS